MMNREILRDIIARALAEDIGPGDWTTQAVLRGDEEGSAQAIAKSSLTLAGGDVFRYVFHMVDHRLSIHVHHQEGTDLPAGEIIATVTGNLGSILTAERTALNFIQRLSGIATVTRSFVTVLKGTKCRLLDTRKTAPGLRMLDKYAVRVGGGNNHRFALYDGILIKDNHIAAAGGVREALWRAQQFRPPTLKIEIEVTCLEELRAALTGGADLVMLDNMSLEEMREAVTITQGRIPLEASGGITLDRIGAIAETGVDFISVGCLTHSVKAADITLMVCPHRDGLLRTMRIHFFPELLSTNTTAFDLALAGAEEGEMVLADQQSQGRGRLDRSWHSPPGKNIYLSLILRPHIPVIAAPQLTPAAGLAVAELISAYFPGQVKIKWPNDVQLQGKKVAGILTEMRASAASVDFVILGIGLNVNIERDDFPAELREKATSLKIVGGQVFCRLSLVAQFIPRWEKWYRIIRTEGFVGIKEPFLSYTAMVGRSIKVTDHGQSQGGVMVGLDDNGTILMRDASGVVRRIVAGDIEFEGT